MSRIVRKGDHIHDLWDYSSNENSVSLNGNLCVYMNPECYTGEFRSHVLNWLLRIIYNFFINNVSAPSYNDQVDARGRSRIWRFCGCAKDSVAGRAYRSEPRTWNISGEPPHQGALSTGKKRENGGYDWSLTWWWWWFLSMQIGWSWASIIYKVNYANVRLVE